MSENMDVDDYPREERDRSLSPRRERSPRRSFDRGDGGDRFRDRERGGGYRDRYDSRGRGGGRGGRYGSDRGGSAKFDDPARFSSNGAFADKTNRNYSKSIFIGNLPFDCSWSQLKEHFQAVGEVTRADIVTSRGQSRGMGTVEFRNQEDVSNAIRKYNHTTFLDREIFVREDNPPPEKRDRGYGDSYGARDSYGGRDRYGGRESYGSRDRFGGRDSYYDSRPPRSIPKGYEVFVGNLPFRTNWQDLKDIFREAGDVVRADVREDHQGRSKGYGIVTYSTREEVDKAIELFKGYEIDGRAIDVRDGKNNARLDAEKASAAGGANAIPVGGADSAAAAGIGAVDTGASSEEVSEFANVQGNGEKGDTVFVGNLPYSTVNEDLYDLFDGIGPIVKAEIQKFGGRPKGSGVVRFENEGDAQVAIDELNGYNYGDRVLKISFASYQ